MPATKRWMYLFILLLSFLSLSTTVKAMDSLPLHFSGCTDEKTVFFAWTADRKNAVEICKVKNGYRYSYGNINKPDVRGIAKEMFAIKLFGSHLPTFVFSHNDISYWLSADKYGIADLMITQGDWQKGTALDNIELDTDEPGYINRVGQMLPFPEKPKP